MDTNWNDAITFVLAMEGGYSNDPNDKGGETNFGISKRSYPNLDIANLTQDEAKAIYKSDYWNACQCDQLPSPLDIAVFDAAVNQGEGAAKRMLQIAMNVDVDGIIGPKTISAAFILRMDGVRHFMAQRMARYIHTILNDNTQNAFAINWSNRLMALAQIIFPLPVSDGTQNVS